VGRQEEVDDMARVEEVRAKLDEVSRIGECGDSAEDI